VQLSALPKETPLCNIRSESYNWPICKKKKKNNPIDYGVSSTNWDIYSTIPAPKTQGTWQKMGWEKSQRTRESAVRICLLEMKGKLHP
jgi:hypothetical protein